MARPIREQSDSRVQDDWIKEGRGLGRNGAYQPWLRVQNVPSLGIRQRLTSHITGDRMNHVLSGLESAFLFIAEWGPSVIDIREQFPLLPLASTLEIADELNIEHPADRITGLPIIPTTDFLVTTLVNGAEEHHAVPIKTIKDVNSLRHQQKLQLARTWHERHGHTWRITTERDISRALASNLEFLRGCRDLDKFGGVPLDDRTRVERVLLPLIWRAQDSLADAAAYCDKTLGLKDGTSLLVAYHFIYTRRWTIDIKYLMTRLRPEQPLILIEPQPKEASDNIHKLPVAMA